MQLLLGDPGVPGPFLAEPSSEQGNTDHRVRYLACESLFNVAKVANEVGWWMILDDGWMIAVHVCKTIIHHLDFCKYCGLYQPFMVI